MLRTQHTNHLRNAKGFTIVEIVVVLVVMGALFPMFSFIIGMYHDTYYTDDKVKMTTETSQALWYMEDTIRVASSFLANVPSEYQDPYGPHNAGSSGSEAWSYKGDSSTNRVILIKSYATTVNALNTGRQAVFINSPEFNCTTQLYYQPELSYISIFFVKDGTLYHRVLTDKTTALCPGSSQQQKQTCPPYITGSSRDAKCEANDEILATQVSGFTVEYYQISQAGSSTQIDPSYSSTDSSVLAAADYATVSITTSARNGAVTNVLKQRMTKVNQ